MATTPPGTSPPPKRPSFIRRFWGFIMFLLTFSAAGLAAYTFLFLRQGRDGGAPLPAQGARGGPQVATLQGARRGLHPRLSDVRVPGDEPPGYGVAPGPGG